MKIVYMRSNPINPDPRVEKEMSVAIECGHIPIALGWNRESDKLKIKKENIHIDDGVVELYKFNIKAGFGAGIKNILPLIIWQIELVKWLIKNRKDYDLIHACDFDTVLPALLMNLIFKKKYIYDIFDFYVDAFSVPTKLKGIIKKIDFLAIKKAEATIIVNETRLKQIEGSKPKKLLFIHNTPKMPQEITKKKEAKYNERKIFYGGILADGRMIEETINICSRHKDWKLVVAGFGPMEKKIQEYVKNIENVKFIGKIQYKQIIQNTLDSDVVFACYDPSVPNHRYSSPNKLYEAMMCKKPIIVCNGTGIDKLVLEKQIGLTCDFNEKSLEEAFISIFENETKYNEMSNNSKKLYETEYKWDIMKNRLKEMYSNV